MYAWRGWWNLYFHVSKNIVSLYCVNLNELTEEVIFKVFYTKNISDMSAKLQNWTSTNN